LFNADQVNNIEFVLPALDEGQSWELILDTARLDAAAEKHAPGEPFDLQFCSVALFRARQSGEEQLVGQHKS
jgi:hypothetical protein